VWTSSAASGHRSSGIKRTGRLPGKHPDIGRDSRLLNPIFSFRSNSQPRKPEAHTRTTGPEICTRCNTMVWSPQHLCRCWHRRNRDGRRENISAARILASHPSAGTCRIAYPFTGYKSEAHLSRASPTNSSPYRKTDELDRVVAVPDGDSIILAQKLVKAAWAALESHPAPISWGHCRSRMRWEEMLPSPRSFRL